MITKAEAQDLADRLDLTTNLVAWGYGGSRMYGLETEESDFDIVIITEDLEPRVEIHADMGNDQDVWAMSLGSYMQGIGACKPNYAILHFASTVHWNKPSPVYSVARMQGINTLGLLDSLSRHIKSDVHMFCCRPLGDVRGDKSLKVATRNTILMRKVRRQTTHKERFVVSFTEYEKRLFNETLAEAREYHGMPAHVSRTLREALSA